MKRIILILAFLTLTFCSHSQNKYEDSLETALSKTNNPLEQFSIRVKILENLTTFQAGILDSASCIQLLQIAQQLKNDSLRAISYNWIGAYLAINKGDNISGLEYYFKAIPLAEKVNDKRRISSLYFDIAAIYYALQNNEEAIKYIRKGEENLPDKSSPMYDYMLIQYQRSMTTYYLLIHQADSALHYLQAMAETNRRLKSILFEFAVYHQSGSTYAMLGENEIAGIYFKKAKTLSDSIKIRIAKGRFYENYIRYLLNNNKIQEAYEEAMQFLNMGIQGNNNNLKLSSAGLLRQVFDKLHQTDSAYYYSRMEADINELIFSQSNVNKIQALAFNEQIRVLEDSSKKIAEEEQRRQNLQLSLIALGIVSLIILFLLLSRRIITNTKLIEFFGIIALLIVFEFLNLLLHPFLENLTHHTPVFILLIMVVIAALLVPLHHRVEKWATKILVEKNKNIRLAAAKKTIQLLSDEKLEGRDN